MPVGTANSTLKSSFSLTSLRSFAPTDNPEHGTPVRLKNERLYHSLTKKSRKSSEQDKELWRKSWGSVISQDGKEFWEGFQADYDYLMAQNILEKTVSEMSMADAKVSIATPTAPPVWSHSEFMDHFAQLYSWLKGIQDLVYGKQENVTDWKLRAERQEDMLRQRFRLDTFNEESRKLIARYPELEGELFWLTKHVNDKWETIEGMLGGPKKGEGDRKTTELGSSQQEKVDHEIKCLRRWLRDLDGKLKPLSFQQGWTKTELEMKAKEHMVLHRDIEAHRKIVSSVYKLCEKADSSTLVAARALERKYHEYYLRSLEWQYHIESLVGLQLNKSPPSWSNDSDGEPVAKIARFTCGKEPEKETISIGDFRRENETPQDSDLTMEISSSEVSEFNGEGYLSKMAVHPEVVESGCDDSILVLEDSSSTNSSVGAQSKNFDGCSGANHVEEEEEEDSRLHFRVGLPRAYVDHVVIRKNVNGPPGYETEDTHLDVVEMTRPQLETVGTGSFYSRRKYDTDSDPENTRGNDRRQLGKDEMAEIKDLETTSSDDGWTFKLGTRSGDKPEPGVRKSKSAVVRLDFYDENAAAVDDGISSSSPREIKYFSANNIPRSSSICAMSNKEPISSSNRRLLYQADELFRCQLQACRGGKQARMKISKEGEKEKPLDSCDASGEYTEDSDERDSQSSEDNDGSIATCKRSGSADGILDETPVGKSQGAKYLRTSKSVIRNRPWSMSNVSQLRNWRGPSSLKARSSRSESALNQMSGQLDKSRELKNDSGRVITSKEDGIWNSYGSARKRRTKNRKRTNKRSNSGSDGVTLSCSCTETDEELAGMSLPRFRLGPKAGAVTNTPAGREKIIPAEEQLSLNSDQAYWDNWDMEKYQSEPYSEEPEDSEATKKLLEFGEDYGKYLGNQSDLYAPSWNRKTRHNRNNKFDSDSDMGKVERFLRQSMNQLDLAEMKLKENDNSGYACVNDFANEETPVSKSFLDEIIESCKRNVDSLTTLLNEINDEMHITKELNYIQVVKENWESLKTTAETHKAKQLKNDMNSLKNELLKWAASIESMETTVTSREELKAKIIQIKDELNTMKKGKSKVLHANVSVHRFLSTAKHAEPTLREEVTELYSVWDQTFSRVSSYLFNLQSLAQTWDDFDDHLSQLQCALRTDTLKVIDFALQCGTSSDVTGSLRDIAGLLSDKEASSTKNSISMGDESIAVTSSRNAITALSTEGSLSDSGISDSGSEHELSEREKRLAQLKRLAKRLESILAPSSQALSNMFKRIEETESGLRELQKTFRDLIVRSSSAEEFKLMVSKTSSLEALDGALGSHPVRRASSSLIKRSKSKGLQKLPEIPGDEMDGVDDKDESKSTNRKSWLWRLVRFALPLQLALVALLCVACLMEPRCCDSLNNLDMSLYPQVRYDSGPPPV